MDYNPSTNQGYLSDKIPLHKLGMQRLAQTGRTAFHNHARGLESRDLGVGAALAAADDGACADRLANLVPLQTEKLGEGENEPACPILLPGGAEIPAMKLTAGLLLVLFSLRKSAASSSADPPISPIMIIPSVSSSSKKTFKQSMKFVPLNGSPPMPTTSDCPSPACVVWLTAS